ncbi:MAG TPA: hypothetical protein VEF05_04750 [Terriglobales bacterium]|nr:hypothetical protein [Terriglobales bacterium]
MQRINTVLVFTLVMLFCQSVFATEFVGTNISSGQLLFISTPNGSAMITATGAKPDGVIFGPDQQIFYVLSGAGTVHIFNPFTRIDITLATGFTTPTNLTMEPGCTSILVSDIGVDKVFRITLSTHVVTTLYNGPDEIQGLTYDNNGNLFAVDDQLNAIVQINTVTGAIVNQTSPGSPLTAPEGLTYDSYTQQLFATSNSGQVLYEVPTTLATVTPIPFAAEPTLHGIISDGHGNLYVVGSNGTTSYVLEYTISSGIEKTLNTVPGLQDIAPILSGPCPKSGGVSEACGGI